MYGLLGIKQYMYAIPSRPSNPQALGPPFLMCLVIFIEKTTTSTNVQKWLNILNVVIVPGMYIFVQQIYLDLSM